MLAWLSQPEGEILRQYLLSCNELDTEKLVRDVQTKTGKDLSDVYRGMIVARRDVINMKAALLIVAQQKGAK